MAQNVYTLCHVRAKVPQFSSIYGILKSGIEGFEIPGLRDQKMVRHRWIAITTSEFFES